MKLSDLEYSEWVPFKAGVRMGSLAEKNQHEKNEKSFVFLFNSLRFVEVSRQEPPFFSFP